MKKKLSVILPIYNPHDNWEKELIAYFSEFKHRIYELVESQLILVNDGSKKNISDAIENIKKEFPTAIYIHNHQNKGKGNAIRTGAHHAIHDYVMYTDYDFPYEVDSMVNMVERFIRESHSITIAKRDNSYYSQTDSYRSIISKALKTMNKFIMRLPVSDTQGGLKLFNQKVTSLLKNTTTDRYLIDIELLKAVHKSRIKITPITVKIRNGINLTNTSNMKITKELQSYLKILIS